MQTQSLQMYSLPNATNICSSLNPSPASPPSPSLNTTNHTVMGGFSLFITFLKQSLLESYTLYLFNTFYIGLFFFLLTVTTLAQTFITFLLNYPKELLWWLSGKESTHQCRRHGSIPVPGRSPGGGNGNPCQYSCLGNPMDREEPGG